MRTYDDHIDHKQAEIVEDDADLEQVPPSGAEGVGHEARVGCGPRSSAELQNRLNRGIRENGAKDDHD